jgi:hypothetical protein
VTRVCVRTFLTTVVLAAASADAGAQSAVCEMVRPGDTAAPVSRRLTGRASGHGEPWFRVFDQSRSRVIPKARYSRLQSGWQACVPAMRAVRHVAETVPRTASTATRALPQGPISAAALSSNLLASSNPRTQELGFLLLALAASGAAVVCGCRSIEQAAMRRHRLKLQMLVFGRAFLSDFERPLRVDGFVDRPVHARIRFVPRQQRLDILLAPGSGRRYPNLVDHKRNVEYDVHRIAHHLRNHHFVPSAPRAEGKWVVIPFHFQLGLSGVEGPGLSGVEGPGPKTGVVS